MEPRFRSTSAEVWPPEGIPKEICQSAGKKHNAKKHNQLDFGAKENAYKMNGAKKNRKVTRTGSMSINFCSRILRPVHLDETIY